MVCGLSWALRERDHRRFGIYSLITIGFVLLSTVFFALNAGGPFMGLTERIPALIGFAWTISLAVMIYRKEYA